MPREAMILRSAIRRMTLKRATKTMYEAYRNGQAMVKSCHTELATLYEERLLKKGQSVGIEPPRRPS